LLAVAASLKRCPDTNREFPTTTKIFGLLDQPVYCVREQLADRDLDLKKIQIDLAKISGINMLRIFELAESG
jgi:hypothetical protein